MCAIHGFFWDSKEQMSKMITEAHHRGPDGNGVYSDEYITLGHNLLSIVDNVNSSTQPWYHNDYVLVYNGEIYNHNDLRQSINYQFKTNTDTETLILGIEKYGKQFIHKIDGMYAFACYNKKTKKLLVARDTNGAKPFYYGKIKNKFVFSSEIKSLLTLGFNRRVNKEAFKHFYYSGLNAGPLTMFEGISKLVPGQILEIDITTGDFISTNVNNDPIPLYQYNRKTFLSADRVNIIKNIRENLKKAVEMTLMGRREIGLFLSGGMDSSTVFYELVHASKTIPNTFSTRFKQPHIKCRYNEDADLASKLSKLFKVNHREVLVGEKIWIDNLEKCVLALEEPRQGKSFPAYYVTNKLLSDNNITVTLSGDGGDELLAGYKHHRLPYRVNKDERGFKQKLHMLRVGHKGIKNKDLDITVNEQWDYLQSWLPKGRLTGDDLNDFLYTECLHTLSEDYLLRNDKLGMAFSMEARFPMMCNVFRDYVRSLPGELKVTEEFIKNNYLLHNKVLLKDAYRHKLPNFILDRNKTGWRAPTDDWIIGTKEFPAPDRSVIKDYFRDLLNNNEIMNIFEYSVNDIDDRFLNNKNHTGHLKHDGPGIGLSSQKELFIIIMFAVWYKLFKMNI